jgi:hypothetical protein
LTYSDDTESIFDYIDPNVLYMLELEISIAQHIADEQEDNDDLCNNYIWPDVLSSIEEEEDSY